MAPFYAEGKYPATVVGQDFDDGQYGVQFLLELEINDNSGNRRTVYLSLTDEHGQRAKYADITIEVLRHLGFAGSEASIARLAHDHANPFSLIGVQCEGYCKHKTNSEGRTGERWYINTPRAGMERTPPAKTALRKLDSLFGKELKEPLPEGAAPPRATQEPEASGSVQIQPGETDGDAIPF
jgi:hypothetical protein